MRFPRDLVVHLTTQHGRFAFGGNGAQFWMDVASLLLILSYPIKCQVVAHHQRGFCFARGAPRGTISGFSLAYGFTFDFQETFSLSG